MVRFDLGPLLQGQTGIAKLKSAYNALIDDPRGLGYATCRKLLAGNLLMWSDLTLSPFLGPLLQGEMIVWRVVFSVDTNLHRLSDA